MTKIVIKVLQGSAVKQNATCGSVVLIYGTIFCKFLLVYSCQNYETQLTCVKM